MPSPTLPRHVSDLLATDPECVGSDVWAVVTYDDDRTPPWSWDWGARMIDGRGMDPTTRTAVRPTYWLEYHDHDLATAVMADEGLGALACEIVADWGAVYCTADDLAMTGAPDPAALVADCAKMVRAYTDGTAQFIAWAIDGATGETLESLHDIWDFDGPDAYPMAEARDMAESVAEQRAADRSWAAAIGWAGEVR